MRKCRFIFVLVVATVIVGCATPAKREIGLDQGTPKAGLLQFLNAIGSGDAVTARKCVYVLPAHARAADDMIELYAAEAVFHHAVNKRFPGEDRDIFWETFTDATLDEMRHHLAAEQATVQGDQAIIVGLKREPAVTARLVHQDWQLHKDAGHWKVDLETQAPGATPPPWDPYPPEPDQDISLAMMFLLHESCPGLRQIAADVEAGKLKSIEEVKAAAGVEAAEGYERAAKKLDAVHKERAAARAK